MFVLCELKHLIRLSPRGFDQPLEAQVKEELNRKLANRVLLKAGLCLAVYDLVQVGESHVLPGDGSAHTEVRYPPIPVCLKGLFSEITRGEGSEIVSIDIILLYEYEPLRGYFQILLGQQKSYFQKNCEQCE
jgi:DNA-directed RNA polymerase subunit E'/Rpb7